MGAGAFPNERIGAEGDYLDRNNVVINVNAPSAIDEEGFTRAVILALNNSTNRGTTTAARQAGNLGSLKDSLGNGRDSRKFVMNWKC